jgi:hopanoid-associated phosphorylase
LIPEHTDNMAVVAVAGMAFEARIAARAGVRVIWRGNEETLSDALSEAISGNCRGVISFGVAGGLAPHLRAGTCVVASSVHHDGEEFQTDQNWSKNLMRAIPRAVLGGVAGASGPVADRRTKDALHVATGAIAVDMESHIVARAAAERGLPFTAIRVIVDSAKRDLPHSALAALRADGTIDLRSMTLSVIRSPRQVPMLLWIARDALVSGLALHRSRRRAGANFGLP